MWPGNFMPGPGQGALTKPKYHYMMVLGLSDQEIQPLTDLKAAKVFLGQTRFCILARIGKIQPYRLQPASIEV